MKKIALLIMLLIALGRINAALWDTITNTNHIYKMAVDEDVIMLATWGGAVMIGPLPYPHPADMEDETVWTTGDGISSNDIRSLAVVGDNLWLGSSADGITIINPQGIQILGTELGLPSTNITAIEAIDSRILVATTNGLAEYYYLPEVSFPLILHIYNSENTDGGLADNAISDMVVLGDYLYLATELGISYVHTDSLDIDSAWGNLDNTNLPPGLSHPVSLATGNGRLLMGSSGRVYASDGPIAHMSGWAAYYPSVNEPITSLAMDEAGKLWIAYGIWNENLSAFSTEGDVLVEVIEGDIPEHNYYQKNQDGLGLKTITDIVIKDSEVYLASWGDGYYQQDGAWQANRTNSIAFPKIQSIALDQNHNPWFTSGYISSQPVKKGSLGICYYKDGLWIPKTMANSGLHNDSVHSVMVDGQNRVWFGAWDAASNHPLGWRFGITIFDEENDEWWELNGSGLRHWDDESQSYGPLIPGMATLYGNTIGGLSLDHEGRIYVASYDRGFTVINPDLTLHSRFTIPNSVGQRVIYHYNNGRQHFVGTNNDNGLVVWNHPSVPETDGDHWLIPDPPELSNCIIYGVASVETPFYGTQHWIAASNGLYMWDESYWYRYDTSIKRYRYSTVQNSWQQDQLYYVDEERLYGSVRTFPSSMLLDPFGRIWIGTLENGISMYDPDTDRFTNYFPSKDPLLSGYITAMAYEPLNGILYIGSPDGLNSLKIGRYIKPLTDLEEVKAFPNPFRPGIDPYVWIANLPADSMPRGTNRCRIFDSSGRLVAEARENEFARFEWDGRSPKGDLVSSGIYFFVVTDQSGEVRRGKIAIIR